MPRIWDYGVYGLVYDGLRVDLTNKVDYITSDTKIIIFRKSGGVLSQGTEGLLHPGWTREKKGGMSDEQ